MNIFLRRTPLGALAFTLALGLTTADCGSDTPTQPTSLTVSGVQLSSSSTAVGTTVQGAVNITAMAPAGGAIVSLTSSNPAVATVPASITIQAGATSSTFSVTAVSAGTATITAALNTSSRATTLTVTAGAPTFSISLSSSTVVGGNQLTGTVTLSGAAPAGGAVVTLSGGDPLVLPANVTVASGATTATFTVGTRAVTATVASTITATYAGITASAAVSVTPPSSPTAIARFGVRGTNVTDTCALVNNGANLECTFDGSTSTAPGTIVAWEWTYTVATTITQTTTTPILSMPSASCSFLPSPPLPAGNTSIPMTVTLKIRDNLGNVSPEATDSGARVVPQGACGY